MLEVQELSVSYGQHRALENASIRVDKAEIVTILGANGAGKTTLLKAIGGISEGNASGMVRMGGVDILGRSPNDIVEEGLALVPEGRGIFGDLSVQENLALGAYSARARDAESTNLERVYSLFPKLQERRRQIARTMSGGEQQMVAIGRAMMSNPSILALDEPSLGLSPLLCKELFQTLKTVRDSGLGILLVEQNAKQSLAIADRGYLLENGHITHEDTAEALIRDPAVQEAYLGAGSRTAPQKTKPEMIHTPTPRPSQTSPSDIAAQAMASIKTPPIAPPPPKVQTKPIVSPPKPQPQESKPAINGGTYGMDINDLVARASATSDRRDVTASNGSTPTIPAVPSQPKLPPAPMPDLGSSADRLKAALQEIETAARRAESYRPTHKP